MTEEEKLRLDVEVDYSDDSLDDLEDDLDAIDRAIADSGRGRESVDIDVNTRGASQAIGEIEALNAAIESVDNDLTIDIDENVNRDFAGGTGSGLATSGGRRNLSHLVDVGRRDNDVLNRMPESVAEAIRNMENPTAKKIESAFEDADVELSDDVYKEVVTATTSNPSTHFDAPFGQGTGSVDAEKTENLFRLLDDDSPISQREKSMRKFRNRLDELTDDFVDTQFTMKSFHDIFAASIPLMAAFIAAIPAAITAIIGLAGAAIAVIGTLGAIGVLGAGGMMLQPDGTFDTQILQDRLSSIFDSFVSAFSPLMGSLAPLMNNVLTDIENMAGPLATASTELLAFRNTFSGFSQFLTTNLPSITRGILQFGDAAMPVLSGIGEWIANADTLSFFATQMSKTLPSLALFAKGLQNLIPPLLSLSQGFLFVVGIVTNLVGGLLHLANISPMITAGFGALAGAILTAATVTSFYTIITNGAIGATLKMVSSLFVHAAASLAASYSTLTFASALGLLISLTVVGIVVVGALATEFTGLSNKIQQATEQLEKFKSLQDGSAGGFSTGSYGGTSTGSGSGNAYTTVINAGSRDDAARQQYSSGYERRREQHVDSVFGG